MRGDIGLDFSQDVLAVHELDSDGHHMGLCGQRPVQDCRGNSNTSIQLFLICSWGSRVAFPELCSWTSPSSLTFFFVFDEALKDEDEMQVVLRVAQRQHGDASHA